jgi:hypothetical protein
MTEKQKNALNKIITALPDNCRKSYLEIAEYAISLGYMPVLTGKHDDKLDFRKSKTKRTILSIRTKNNSRQIAMKFYALSDFVGVFKEALDARFDIENMRGFETRCFECGLKCGLCDATHGYSITLPDGKYGFGCGHDVVSLPTFCTENIQEVKEALKIQDEFYLKQPSK